MQANCDPSRHRATVVDYAWGDDPPPSELQQPPPDIITGADLVYDPKQYGALVAALERLAAPHTLVFLAIKLRGGSRGGWLEGDRTGAWVAVCLELAPGGS